MGFSYVAWEVNTLATITSFVYKPPLISKSMKLLKENLYPIQSTHAISD